MTGRDGTGTGEVTLRSKRPVRTWGGENMGMARTLPRQNENPILRGIQKDHCHHGSIRSRLQIQRHIYICMYLCPTGPRPDPPPYQVQWINHLGSGLQIKSSLYPVFKECLALAVLSLPEYTGGATPVKRERR